MKNVILYTTLLLIFSACSSQQKVASDDQGHEQPDVVLARIDNMKERPDWARESETFFTKDGQVFFLGRHQVDADSNLEQAFRSSELNAKAGIAKAIEQKFTFVFQNAEEGYSVDASQARFMGIEASKEIKTGNIRSSKRYWEKFRTTTNNGQRVTKYLVFSLVQMPEADFKAAILDAARARQGKGGLSQDFANKVNQQWDTFTKTDEPNDRNPAKE